MKNNYYHDLASFFLLLISIFFFKIAIAADNSVMILGLSEKEFAREMKAGSELYSEGLPARIDATTVLQSVSYTPFDKTYMYRYTVINSMDEKLQRAALVSQQCASPNLSAFMKRGVTLRSLYFGPNQKMTDIEVRITDCRR